jgi:tetratricopeptide (TPR) repeat protein
MVRGDTDDAERFANAALEHALDTGEPDALTIFGVQLLSIRWQQGRLDELVAPLRQAVEEQPRLPGFRALLAWALANSAKLEEARVLVDVEARDGFKIPRDITWLASSCIWSEVVARVDHTEAARFLFEQLEPWAAQLAFADIGVFGATAHYLGMLAACFDDRDAAERFFVQALDIHTTMGAPFFVANTEAEYASLLARSGTKRDSERARELLTDALQSAQRGGYAGVERAALAALAQLPH